VSSLGSLLSSSISDLYDLAGLPTNGGFRAHGEIYGEARKSAVAIQRIEEHGGIIVGKLKCSK
jgi:Asp-tRNA(Asn)/Glu-tRNA(Gln) amidotransferase A subunit family amidase